MTKHSENTKPSNSTKPVLNVVIETSYQQKQFIKDKLRPVFIFLNTLKKKPENMVSELIRENGEFKNYIGIDFTYKKGSDKNLVINLFWGKYDKLNNDEDYFKLIDNCKNEYKIELKKEFDVEKNIMFVTNFFNEKLSSL